MMSSDFPSIVSPTSMGRAKGGRAPAPRVLKATRITVEPLSATPQLGALAKTVMAKAMPIIGALNKAVIQQAKRGKRHAR